MSLAAIPGNEGKPRSRGFPFSAEEFGRCQHLSWYQGFPAQNLQLWVPLKFRDTHPPTTWIAVCKLETENILAFILGCLPWVSLEICGAQCHLVANTGIFPCSHPTGQNSRGIIKHFLSSVFFKTLIWTLILVLMNSWNVHIYHLSHLHSTIGSTTITISLKLHFTRWIDMKTAA